MSLVVWIALVVGGLAWLWHALRPRLIPGMPFVPLSSWLGHLGHLPSLLAHLRTSEELTPFFETMVDQLGGAPIAQVLLEPGAKPWILVTDYQESVDILSVRSNAMREV